MELIFRHELTAIFHSRVNNLLHIKWNGYSTGEDYLTVMRAVMKFTTDLAIENWLFDLGGSDRLMQNSFHWNMDYLFDILAKTKLKKIARVDSKDPDYEEQVRKIASEEAAKHNLPIKVAFFKTRDDAFAWLAG